MIFREIHSNDAFIKKVKNNLLNSAEFELKYETREKKSFVYKLLWSSLAWLSNIFAWLGRDRVSIKDKIATLPAGSYIRNCLECCYWRNGYCWDRWKCLRKTRNHCEKFIKIELPFLDPKAPYLPGIVERAAWKNLREIKYLVLHSSLRSKILEH